MSGDRTPLPPQPGSLTLAIEALREERPVSTRNPQGKRIHFTQRARNSRRKSIGLKLCDLGGLGVRSSSAFGPWRAVNFKILSILLILSENPSRPFAFLRGSKRLGTTDEHGWTQMGMKEIQNLKRTTDNRQRGMVKIDRNRDRSLGVGLKPNSSLAFLLPGGCGISFRRPFQGLG